MGGFAAAGRRATLRARRWDVIMLGGALPGLVAATRLAMRRLRVLLVEEQAAADTPACLREPFLLSGAKNVLDTCLRELRLPLIDRRRIRPDPIAYQVILADARVNVGGARATAEELATWGLAGPEAALALVQSLERAARAEAAALLEGPVVRTGGLRARVRAASAPAGVRHDRGLPAEAAAAEPPLDAFLEAQVGALSNLGGLRPPPEARARLLGGSLEGGAVLDGPGASLRDLLRRRLLAVHGEIRPVGGGFDLVTIDGNPGLGVDGGGEVWAGRALILNCARGALAGFLRESGKEVPDALDGPGPEHRRQTVRLRAPRELLPEGMARRLILCGDPAAPCGSGRGRGLTLSVHPAGDERADLVGAAVRRSGEDPAGSLEDALRAWATRILPFSEGRLEALPPPPLPRWDDDALLADPRPGEGWPGEVDLRASSRPLVYRLAREGLAGLGLEGDLVLGLRAGDAIAAELSA